MSEKNRRVLNATTIEYNEKKFRSKLEVFCYKKLIELGVDFTYEEVKVDLISSLNFTKLRAFYPIESGKKRGQWQEVFKINKKSYTPDFVINYLNYYIVIECKGFANDDYPTKRKLFLAYLEDECKENNLNPIFLEPHNQKQINMCIDFIKQLN